MKRASVGAVKRIETHFEYVDGTIFYPVGTTVYALLYQEAGLWEETMESMVRSSFNKVRFCLFPKYYDWNRSEPPFFPFSRENGHWNIKKPVPAFWERLHTTLYRLEGAGIQADLILLHPYDRWGFSELPKEDAIAYLTYTVKTLGFHPNIWWCLANEYDLLDYSPEDWASFAECIRQQDPGNHLLSIHNAIHLWDFSDRSTTHVSVQTGDIVFASSLAARYGKPVIVEECGYEGNLEYNWGNLSAEEMTQRFWTAVSRGIYCTHGETLLQGKEREILWWSHGGYLRGESWKRIAFLRQILESLPGPLTFQDQSYVSYSVDTIHQIAALPPKMRPEGFRHGQYLKGLLTATPEEVHRLQSQLSPNHAAFHDKAFLWYFGRSCPSSFPLRLPAGKTYQIQIIDTWNMIAKSIFRTDHPIPLPGAPYMAILAVEAL